MTDVAAIRARLEALARTLPDLEATESQGVVTWSAAGHPFAIVSDAAVELRLSEPVATAAAKTPDTTPSPRGLGWVRFAPPVIDGHAIDRLEAWFAFAFRHAADASGPAATARRQKPV